MCGSICLPPGALSTHLSTFDINKRKCISIKIYFHDVVTFYRHPEIKRQICKKCRCILIHNVSGKMKIKNKSKSKTIEWTCNTCGTKRNFPANKNKDHRVWLEKPEAVVEVIS